MKKLLFGIILCLTTQTLLAQYQQRRCATSEMVQYSLETYPHVRAQMEAEEQIIQDYIAKAKANPNKSSAEIITIPTVVHIVWTEGISTSNISDDQIYSQIEALNLAFRKQNENAKNIRSIFADIAADVEIEFCLAQVDPDGNPTEGITRTPTSARSFEVCGPGDRVGTDCELMKYSNKGGKTGWPTDKYLNIWVVNDLSDTVLGYAYLPGSAPNSLVDGFVVVHRAFGTLGSARFPYNGGATSVHEIGHWLGLRHPWGNGDDNPNCIADDGINDTPRINGHNFECDYDKNSCDAGQAGDLPDMVENFMDYPADACISMFTLGQKSRMRGTIEAGAHRSVGQNSVVCTSILNDIDAALIQVDFPLKNEQNCSVFSPVIQLQNMGKEPLFFATIDYTIGKTGTGQQYTWSYTGTGDGIVTWKSELISLPPISIPVGEAPVAVTDDGPIYELLITVNNPNVSVDQDPANNSIIHRFPIITGAFKNGITEDFESGNFPPSDWENSTRSKFESFTGASANGVGNTCMYINNDEYPGLYNDDAISLKELDLSGMSGPELSFDYAYAQKDSAEIADEFLVLINIDCGEVWDTLFYKTGYFLATADAQANSFVPEASDWKTRIIDLYEYRAARNARIKFVQIRGKGNNFYLDNINVSDAWAVGVETPVEDITTLQLYPNPATQFTQIQYTLDNSENSPYQLRVYDKLGRLVASEDFQANQYQGTYFLNTQTLSAGMYFIELSNAQAKQQAKLLIVK